MAVYKTPQAEQDYFEVIKESARKWGKTVADEMRRQLKEVEEKLAQDPHYGKLDPEYHSDRFKYVQIQNRKKIFFERHGNDVFIVMVEGDTRNYKEIFAEMTPYIDRQITAFKERLCPLSSPARDTPR